MNVKSLLLAASIAVATGNAFAADTAAATPAASREVASQAASPSTIGDAADGAPATLTRAQVHAEVLAAGAGGTLAGPGDDVDFVGSERSTPTGRFDAAAHPALAKVGSWFRNTHASTPIVDSN